MNSINIKKMEQELHKIDEETKWQHLDLLLDSLGNENLVYRIRVEFAEGDLFGKLNQRLAENPSYDFSDLSKIQDLSLCLVYAWDNRYTVSQFHQFLLDYKIMQPRG